MVDVLLVQPSAQDRETTYAPLSLLSLAAVLERDGYEVKIIDARFEEQKAKLLDHVKKEPLLVGITSMTGEQIKHGLDISRAVRNANPNTRIVWGGVHASSFPQQTLANQNIDMVVRNEGDETLLELAKAIESGAGLGDVKGLSYKDGEGRIRNNPQREFVDMDNLPMPAWHLVDVEAYVRNLSLGGSDRPIDISTSRGCPHRCSFCYNLDFNRRKWRGRSVPLVMDELKYLNEKHRINRIIFHDDNFPTNMKRALSICEELIKDRVDIKWTCTMRANYVQRESLKKMIGAGMYQIRMGAESGSPKILSLLQKDITVEQIIESAKIARELDMEVLYSFVIGWPTETEVDRRMTLGLMFKLADMNPKSAFYPLWIYTPYPGSPLYDKAVELGFKAPTSLEEWGEFKWARANIPWEKNTEKIQAMHLLSTVAFSNKKFGSVLRDLASGKLNAKTALWRIGGALGRGWARMRFKHDIWAFPYETEIVKRVVPI